MPINRTLSGLKCLSRFAGVQRRVCAELHPPEPSFQRIFYVLIEDFRRSGNQVEQMFFEFKRCVDPLTGGCNQKINAIFINNALIGLLQA